MNEIERKAAEVQLGVLKLQHLLLKQQVKGDTPGHPFRGNQHSGGGVGGGSGAEGSVASSNGAVSSETAKKYNIDPEMAKRQNNLAQQGRLMVGAKDMDRYIKSRVKKPGEGVGIGDVVIPSKGAFKDVPLWVNGFGGSEMSLQLTPGVGPGFGPKGKASFLVCNTMYKDGMGTGVRLELPISEH